MAEDNVLETLIKLSVLEPTDEPCNTPLAPRLPHPNFISKSKPTDDLQAFTDNSAYDGFWVILGHAIQAHSRLEQAMCCVFESVSSLSHEIAGLIFYKITNTRTRDSILEKLM